MHGRVDAWSLVPLASHPPLVGRVDFGGQATSNRGWQGRAGWEGRFRRSTDFRLRLAGPISEVKRRLGGVSGNTKRVAHKQNAPVEKLTFAHLSNTSQLICEVVKQVVKVKV